MNIAVDLDGVLADIHRPTADRSDRLTWEQVASRNFTDEDWDEYRHVSQNLWHNHWDQIPLVEEGVVEEMERLAQQHTVTILTHRCNVDSSIEQWLADNGIHYHELIATHEDKETFGYDFYIDDNPLEARHLLRDQPWNRHIETTNRIHTFIGVGDYIQEIFR